MQQYELIQDVIVSYKHDDISRLREIYNSYGKQIPHYPQDPYDERRVILTFIHYMIMEIEQEMLTGVVKDEN